MDHIAVPLRILLAEKEGGVQFNITCLKLYQFKRSTWWCLCVLQFAVQSVMLEKTLKKKHDLMEFASGPPLRGGYDANSGRPCTLIHNLPCSTPCRLFIHELFFTPSDLHLLVWNEHGRSPPFRPMRPLTLPWSRTSNLMCEVALNPYLQGTNV